MKQNQLRTTKRLSVLWVHESGECRNDPKETFCCDWASKGECDVNPSFMLQSCSASCGLCGETESCVSSVNNYQSRAPALSKPQNDKLPGKLDEMRKAAGDQLVFASQSRQDIKSSQEGSETTQQQEQDEPTVTRNTEDGLTSPNDDRGDSVNSTMIFEASVCDTFMPGITVTTKDVQVVDWQAVCDIVWILLKSPFSFTNTELGISPWVLQAWKSACWTFMVRP